MSTAYCLTTSPENFHKTAELGWKLQGIKAGRGKTAKQLEPGDKLVYYVTKEVAFGAVATVASSCFEDHEPIWAGKPAKDGKSAEDYPWRVEITPEVVVADPDHWVPADELYEQLTYVQRWPREHWKLAFQGNIREWPWEDYEVVRAALARAAGQGAV